MNVTAEKTAVVLIEYQNDFTSEGGTLHDAVKDVMAQTQMLENSKAVATAAREAGARSSMPRSPSRPATPRSPATPTAF